MADLTCLAWSRDDRRLFAGTRSGGIVVWDARTGERRQTLSVGHRVVSLVAHGSGLVVEFGDGARLLLTWRVAPDGILEDLTWETAPPNVARMSVQSHAQDREARHHDGAVVIWPFEGTECWWLGRLRDLTKDDREMPTLGQRGAMHDELVRCDAYRRSERGLVIASKLLLVDDARRGMHHIARGRFCHDIGDQRGEFFELWEAERLRQDGELGDLMIKSSVVETLGRELQDFERGIADGVIDADDGRLANVASRAYDAAFDALKMGDREQSLAWLVDSLAVRPQAVTWFYAGKLLAFRHEYVLARWCLDRAVSRPVEERVALGKRVEPAAFERMYTTCSQLAEQRVA